MNFIFISVFLVVGVTVDAAIYEPTIDGINFWVDTELWETFDKAITTCKSRNMTLIEIKSSEDYLKVGTVMEMQYVSSNKSFWLGGKMEYCNNFVWIYSQTEVVYGVHGKPELDDRCLTINDRKHIDDWWCNSEQRTLCWDKVVFYPDEVDSSTISIVPVKTDAVIVSSEEIDSELAEWIHNSGQFSIKSGTTFWIGHSKVYFDEAILLCKRHNMTLIEISSVVDYLLVKSALGIFNIKFAPYWLGGKVVECSSRFKWINSKTEVKSNKYGFSIPNPSKKNCLTFTDTYYLKNSYVDCDDDKYLTLCWDN